jgi:hypothetical protein
VSATGYNLKPSRESGPLARAAVAIDRLFATKLFQIWAFAVLLLAVLLSLRDVLSIGFLFERNYNEGWNVYNAARLIDHQLIYDDNYWRTNNYPIGSFFIIGAVNLLVNDLLLSGRVVCFVGFAAIGLLAGAATRRFGGTGVDAVFGAGCTLGFCYLAAPAWIVVDDPQTLAEAVMLGGLVSYISRPPSRLRLLGAAFLVVLAGFIKHNLLGIPLAITLDLAIRSPRRLPFWLACSAGWLAAFLGLTEIFAGGAFLGHLLSPRVFTWWSVHHHLMKFLRTFKFPLLAIIVASRRVFTGPRVVLAAWGLTSVVLATMFSGFEGTSYNMFQDAAVFLGTAAGVMFCELGKAIAAAADRDWRTKVLASLAAFLLAQPVWARASEAASNLFNVSTILVNERKDEQEFLDDAKYISRSQRLAICESLLLCYVAGEPFVLDPFNSRQYIVAGKLDQGELTRRIAAQEFAVIQLRADICDDPATTKCHILHYPQKFNRFTDDTLYAIDRYYKIDRRSRYGTFYVPKEPL